MKAPQSAARASAHGAYSFVGVWDWSLTVFAGSGMQEHAYTVAQGIAVNATASNVLASVATLYLPKQPTPLTFDDYDGVGDSGDPASGDRFICHMVGGHIIVERR